MAAPAPRTGRIKLTSRRTAQPYLRPVQVPCAHVDCTTLNPAKTASYCAFCPLQQPHNPKASVFFCAAHCPLKNTFGVWACPQHEAELEPLHDTATTDSDSWTGPWDQEDAVKLALQQWRQRTYADEDSTEEPRQAAMFKLAMSQ